MSIYKIEEGDEVEVCISDKLDVLIGKIHGTPAATGDSWRLCESGSGHIYYIQQFLYMRKR